MSPVKLLNDRPLGYKCGQIVTFLNVKSFFHMRVYHTSVVSLAGNQLILCA